MANGKMRLYPHDGEQLTLKEIHRLVLKRRYCSYEYVRDKMNKRGWTVQQVIDTPVLSASARATKGAKASKWGMENYNKVMGQR